MKQSSSSSVREHVQQDVDLQTRMAGLLLVPQPVLLLLYVLLDRC
jgi:hypothetical protein